MNLETANLRRIFSRARGQAWPMHGFCLAGVLLLAGCATQQAPSSLPPLTPAAQPADVNSSQSSAKADAQPAAPSGPVSVEAAIERAISCNPKLKALRADVTVARQRKSAATDIPDPEALVYFGDVVEDFGQTANSSNSKGDKFGGRINLPNPFLMVPEVNARTADFQAALSDLQAARWLVESDVRRLFAEIQYLSEDMALTVELTRQNGLILAYARERESQGAAVASDIVTAVQRQLQAQHDLDQARYRWQLARRELAALLDLNSESLQLVTNTPAFAPLPESDLPIEALQQTALERREDVAALRWRTLAAQSSYQEARNVRIPWFKDFTALQVESNDKWAARISVNVPIFSWTINKAETVQQAQANLAAVNESNGIQVMRREIRDAVDEFEARRQQQKRDQNDIAPLIAEMRQTLELLRRTPTVLPSRIAATEAQITESLRLELGSRWLYLLARLNLERVVGAPLSVALMVKDGKM